MTVRAIQARIECDRQTLENLWRSHRVFNERLPRLLKFLFKMRRRECGNTDEERNFYQTVAHFVLQNSRNADYLLNSVSIRNWEPGTAKKYKAKLVDDKGNVAELTGESWVEMAAELSSKGTLLYDKQELLGDLPGAFGKIVCRECAAIINGHDELTHNWRVDHDKWLRSKAEWECEEENKKYLAVRPRFEQFEEKAGGKATKRRGRWHLYIAWLRENPDLAAWRGGSGIVNDLSAKAQERIKRAKPKRERSVEAEEFWRVNHDLAALDKLHGFYEREFVRRRKTKKNPDGFDHRPTFTLPHPMLHPRWFVFNAPQTGQNGYRSLKLPEKEHASGSIELRLLTQEKTGDKYPSDWIKVKFRSDPRLLLFRPVKRPSKKKTSSKEKNAYQFLDPYMGMPRPAEISGAKLILKKIQLNPDGLLKSAVPYLYFTCAIKDLPLTENAKKIEWLETGEVTKSGKTRKKMKLPDGLVACAVDLGLRHLGFATLAVYENGKPRVLRSRNIWLGQEEGKGCHPGRWSPGPDLAHIGKHKRKIRWLRRLRGKPIREEESHIELQDHITHMGEDRFKKAARALVNFALNVDKAAEKKTGSVFPRADILLLESLEGLIPDAEKERGINRALAQWNRGQLVKAVKNIAKGVGLRLREISPVGTSQVCSLCGALGRRYSIVKDERTGKPDIQFGIVEKLFVCPQCGYRANADHNASVNLHRRFLLGDGALGAFFGSGKSETERRRVREELENTLLPRLRQMHGLAAETETAPF